MSKIKTAALAALMISAGIIGTGWSPPADAVVKTCTVQAVSAPNGITVWVMMCNDGSVYQRG